MNEETEYCVICPYCAENISMVIEPSEEFSTIQDCEVCCRPIVITTQYDATQLCVRVYTLDDCPPQCGF